MKGQPKEPCPTCEGTDWHWRLASELGGPGEWLCDRCHPGLKERII